MTHFAKIPLTPRDILSKLVSQGLTIPPAQHADAIRYLRYIGAFRLKGYWFHLLHPVSKTFVAGVTFQDIVDRYEFDSSLRAITSKAIEKLEVAIRTNMSDTLSQRHGSDWFLKPDIFSPNRNWGIGMMLSKIEHETRRSDSLFIEHYYKKYTSPYLPPSWAITECVTFGFWSRTFEILKDARDKKSISMHFGVDKHEVFVSWIHALTYLRNVCAHHVRIIGHKLKISPANYKSKGIRFSDNRSFYSIATVISFLLTQTNIPNDFKSSLVSLFSSYPNINPAELGFPPNWQTAPGW